MNAFPGVVGQQGADSAENSNNDHMIKITTEKKKKEEEESLLWTHLQLCRWMDQYHTINELPHRTAQVPARRPGITTGFSTGKKLPHTALRGCSQPHEAYNPVGIHQMAPPWAHIDKHA